MIFTCVKCANNKNKNMKNTKTNAVNDEVPEDLAILLKSGLFKDIKNDIPICRMHKYKNTNTEIRKYTNTANDEVPPIPNIWYIF